MMFPRSIALCWRDGSVVLSTATLPEGPSSVLSTHIVAPNPVCLDAEDLILSSGLSTHLHMHMCACTDTHIHTINTVTTKMKHHTEIRFMSLEEKRCPRMKRLGGQVTRLLKQQVEMNRQPNRSTEWSG